MAFNHKNVASNPFNFKKKIKYMIDPNGNLHLVILSLQKNSFFRTAKDVELSLKIINKKDNRHRISFGEMKKYGM